MWCFIRILTFSEKTHNPVAYFTHDDNDFNKQKEFLVLHLFFYWLHPTDQTETSPSQTCCDM